MTTSQAVLILLPILLVSISVHEMMHALSSHLLGDDTAAEGGRISLNPLRHIDPYLTVLMPIITMLAFGQFLAIAKPVMVNFRRLRYGEFGGAIVAAAGPFSNLILAFVFASLYHWSQPLYGSVAYNILTVGCEFNIALMVLNLIPWPPLDGSRILYAFAPSGLQEFMDRIESAGLLTLAILLLIFYSSLGQSLWGFVSSLMAHLGVPQPVL